MACLSVIACSNSAPAPVELASPAPQPAPSTAESDDAKAASCSALRVLLGAEKSLRVLVTLDVSLEDQAAVDAVQKAVQSELPAGSATDLQVIGAALAVTIQAPALEVLCASPQVAMVAKPRIGKLN